MSQRKPKRARESQRELDSEPERARVSQIRCEPDFKKSNKKSDTQGACRLVNWLNIDSVVIFTRFEGYMVQNVILFFFWLFWVITFGYQGPKLLIYAFGGPKYCMKNLIIFDYFQSTIHKFI